MATYVEMRTDAFKRNLDSIVENKALDFAGVRRPFRGIEIKDETFAIIKVIRSDGSEIPLVDAGATVTPDSLGVRKDKEGFREVPPEGSTFNYSNFIAQTIIDSRSEKQQIVETFGEPFIFFYGEKPRILNVQGLLLNTMDFNWKNEFWKNYETYLRGTRLVELDARVYFYFDDQIVEGYLLDASASHDAQLPYHVPFQFTIFVTAHTYLGLLSSTADYPISANVSVPTQKDLREIQNVDVVLQKLRARKDKLRPDELISTTEDVAQAAYQAAGGVIGKKAIMSAVISGMSDYQAKTYAFLDNIKKFFYGRRMVVPTGLLGAEGYVGTATYANQATMPGKSPKRTLPLRSKIYLNEDEYVGGNPARLPQATMEEAMGEMELTDAQMELVLLSQLGQMGVDITPVTAGQNWRAKLTHTMTKTADKIDFTAGLARGTLTSLREKGLQAFSLATSLPGTLTAPVGAAKAAVPFYVP